MQHLLFKDYQLVPWKNGLGKSLLIDSGPNQTWRLSLAQVLSACTFSNYDGYQRVLTVWRGQGLKLNDHFLYPKEFYHFDGSINIFCENLSSEVTDLGLIYDPKLYSLQSAFYEVLNLTQINLIGDLHFIFCFQGTVKINSQFIQEGDTLKLAFNQNIEINSENASICVFTLRLNSINLLI